MSDIERTTAAGVATPAERARGVLYPRRVVALTRIVLLLAALALVACGGEDAGGPSDADPRALLKSAFSKQIETGVLDAKLAANMRGGDAPQGPMRLELKGPFASRGQRDVPQFDWDVTVGGGGLSLTGGLLSTGENAYVEFQGQAYEVGEELMGQLREQLRRKGDVTAQSLGLEPAGWIKDPKAFEGGEVGGTETTKVTGTVDVPAALDDLVEAGRKLERQGKLDRKGERGAPTAEQRRQVERSVKKANVEVYVADDGTLRRFVLDLELEVPEDARADLRGFEGGAVEIDVQVTDVGERPEIEAPSGAKPLGELLGRFGLGGAPAGVPQ
jgi:hypothetical protein